MEDNKQKEDDLMKTTREEKKHRQFWEHSSIEIEYNRSVQTWGEDNK